MKIISAAPSNTEIIYKLGLQKNLAATTSLCNHPREALEKPSIGGWSQALRYSKIEEINPDIVLLSDALQNEQASKIREMGYETLQVNPSSLEEVFESIVRVGRELGEKDKASRIVEEMRRGIGKTDLKGRRIYCEEWMSPQMVSGNWIPGLIEEGDGEYFIGEERSRKFKLDRLKRFDPEYIFLNVCGAGKNVDTSKVLNRPEWQSITAVENGNIYVVDDALLNRPGPRLVDGLREIERKI